MGHKMVSVAMATYNGEKWISQQLESILKQLGKDDEVVIADDNSSDSTVKLIEEFNDSRIKLSVYNDNVGASKNFEKALRKTAGEYIFLADQDDIWLDNKVAYMLEALKENSLVMHDATVINRGGKTIYDSYFAARTVKHGVVNNIIKNSYTGAFMAFRREVLKDIFPIPNGLFYDHWIALVCEMKKNTLFVDKKLSLWRRHENTVTTFNKFNKRDIIKMLFSRVRVLFALSIIKK